MRSKKVVDEMTAFPFRADPGMSTAEARVLMKKAGVRHLPVIDERSSLVGLISDRDLRTAEGFEDRASLKVSDIMHEDVYKTHLGTPLSYVIEQMIERRVGSAVVVNRVGQVVGIFTTTDALMLLRQLLKNPDSATYTAMDVEEFLSGHA